MQIFRNIKLIFSSIKHLIDKNQLEILTNCIVTLSYSFNTIAHSPLARQIQALKYLGIFQKNKEIHKDIWNCLETGEYNL